MTEEPRPENQGTDNPTTAVAEGTPAQADDQTKLHQQVEIRDVGPCRKHVKVSVERRDFEGRMQEKFKELLHGAAVNGFRPGKAPRKIVEKQFGKEVGEQVKAEVLLASLQQLADEHDLAPLTAPDIDPDAIDLPNDGPLVYEFEVEVRPEFDLPNYKGLKLKRPTHTFTEEEIVQEERRLLSPYGQIVPKPEGNAQPGDVLIADAVVREGSREIGTMTEAQFRVDKVLAFKDGVAGKFAEQVAGANPGDKRTVDITLSSAVADPSLRGKTVQMALDVKDVKTQRLPELTHDFLHNFGVHSAEQLRELIRVVLERRLEHEQRRSARLQVLEQIAAAATWDLPEDLLRRQARSALNRRAIQMRADGIAEEEIAGRLRLLQQDVLRSTELELKEHFVLQKIAEVEKIEVNDDDMEAEIDRMAGQSGESPRRVRARLEKDDLLEALAAEMIERKALDLILDSAEYEEVALAGDAQPSVATIEAQAVPGEMHDPTATPEEAPGEAAPNA